MFWGTFRFWPLAHTMFRRLKAGFSRGFRMNIHTCIIAEVRLSAVPRRGATSATIQWASRRPFRSTLPGRGDAYWCFCAARNIPSGFPCCASRNRHRATGVGAVISVALFTGEVNTLNIIMIVKKMMILQQHWPYQVARDVIRVNIISIS